MNLLDPSLLAVSGDLREMAGKMGNVLELVTEKRYPVIGDIKAVMKKYGALNAMMSGSGPTVFGLFESEKAAKKAYWALRNGRLSNQVRQLYVTDFFNNREVSNGL